MTTQADIDNLLEHFSKNSYSTKGNVTGMLVMNTCLDLFGKDYTYTIINNSGGVLCGHYPSKLVVLDYEGPSGDVNNRFQPLLDRKKLEELMRGARVARCRTRFVAPVILYKGKHICRSATLAGWQELFGRKGMDMVLSGGSANGRAYEDMNSSTQSNTGGSRDMFDRHRGRDIQLLEELNVKYICDLMVENKKVKCGFYITSSEKVDKENRYKNFRIISLPYPGCELFGYWKESNYDSENIRYDWTKELNTALLDLQNDPILMTLPLEWEKYKDWSLVMLTQNYLLALINLIHRGSSGVLVHCISGWDRTPLYISLLRLSLWADGAVHKSLSASDILYLTLAYDWYLFGHGLPDRLSRGEEILYFCFKMLRYICDSEFSVNPQVQCVNTGTTVQKGSLSLRQESRHSSPSSGIDVDGLKHISSNISLTSDASFGSDGPTFFLDNTHDEEDDGLSPLDWEVSPSPQRSRNPSATSVDEHRSIRYVSAKSNAFNTDCCSTHPNSPPPPPHFHRHRRVSSGSSLSEGSRRGRSPEISFSPESRCHRHCGTGGCDQPLSNSAVSNYFSSSSPVSVPCRQPENDNVYTPTPSFGSWVDVGIPQMTPPYIITHPIHSTIMENQCSVNSCHEASDLNTLTTRKHRLILVAQMFEEAYFKAVLSRPGGSSGGLSSLIGNVAEKMGFRSMPR